LRYAVRLMSPRELTSNRRTIVSAPAIGLRHSSAAAGLRRLRVELLVALREPAREVLDGSGLPLSEEVLDEVRVGLARRHDRRRARMGGREDREERREVRVRRDLLRRQRSLRRRNGPQAVLARSRRA